MMKVANFMPYRISTVLLATSKHVTEDNPKSIISRLTIILGFPRLSLLVFSAMLGMVF
jgi:hypothetical protein